MGICFRNQWLPALAIVGAISACVPGPSPSARVAVNPSSPATIEQASELFQQTCLAALPDFSRVEEIALNMGLMPVDMGPGISAFILPDTMLVTMIVPVSNFSNDESDGLACAIASDGPFDGSELGRALLADAREVTGGEGETFPSSFYDIAEHLPNGSVFTNDLRPKNHGMRSIVIMSIPIERDRVANFIYN